MKIGSNPASEILQETLLYQTRWVELVQVRYRDDGGQERFWDCVRRPKSPNAAAIVAQLQPSGRYLLIKQYRPPQARYVIEFPAGLIDPGESAATSALRELKEETGYSGELLWITPALPSSPGMLSEAIHLAFVRIEEQAPGNQELERHLEPNEHIQVFTKLPAELPEFFRHELQNGAIIDLKVAIFFSQALLPEVFSAPSLL